MTVGVAVGIATILEDFLSGGAGVADDPLSFSVAFELFRNGYDLSRIALERWRIIIGDEEYSEAPEPISGDAVKEQSPFDASL